MFQLPNSLVKLELSWLEFKKYLDATFKELNAQYVEYAVEEAVAYQLIAIDGQFLYTCEIVKASPASTDQTDFETSWKSKCNKQLYRSDTDRGGLSVKPAIHKVGYSKCPLAFYFTTGNSTVDTKHQPLAASIVKTYDAETMKTKVVLTIPFANGVDIEGVEVALNSPEDLDIFRAWLEHPSYPGVNQGWMIHSYLVETNKKEDVRIAGPTCSFIPAGMKLVFEYFSQSTEVNKRATVNLISWLKTTTAEKTIYTMPKT